MSLNVRIDLILMSIKRYDMNKFLATALLFLSYLSINSCIAQSYIVEFESDNTANSFFTKSKNAVLDIHRISKSTPIFNVYANALKENDLINLLNDPSVKHFMKNERVYKREIPNDNRFNQQWPLTLIQADKVWDIVEQGQTVDNREIVIAILDDSFQIDHPDLVNNIWTNNGEIPNDNIDNDNNGYVDDYYGLHIPSNSDEHPVGSHGTKVAGIIGAEGNNSIGIAGVNWKIKLMILSGAEFISDIIEGYDYVKEQRKLHNETNGAEGAFVVATNFSAGIPYAFGTDYPSWCNVYDDLGEVGIISVTATDNSDHDVDSEGDMPTTCASEFMLATTSTNSSDSKSMFAAFGAENIDIGAPGDNTFSTVNGGDYEDFTGTSAAAPHMAGAIGLIYAAKCEFLMENAMVDPAETALLVKDLILNSAEPLSSLSSRTVSGGRLDIFGALTQLSGLCNGGMTSQRDKLSFINIGPNPVINDLNFQYYFANFVEHEIKIYNTIGQLVHSETITPSLFETKVNVLELEHLIQGAYLLNISDGETKLNFKFFKS